MVKQRLKFECWQCHQVFERDVELPTEKTSAVLLVKCNACGAQSGCNLNNFVQTNQEILRGNETYEETVLELPDVLPTEPVK